MEVTIPMDMVADTEALTDMAVVDMDMVAEDMVVATMLTVLLPLVIRILIQVPVTVQRIMHITDLETEVQVQQGIPHVVVQSLII